MHSIGPSLGWLIGAGVVWLAVVFGALWGAIRVIHRSPPRTAVPCPLDILEHRFAAGEITREEFDEARARLREHQLDL